MGLIKIEVRTISILFLHNLLWYSCSWVYRPSSWKDWIEPLAVQGKTLSQGRPSRGLLGLYLIFPFCLLIMMSWTGPLHHMFLPGFTLLPQVQCNGIKCVYILKPRAKATLSSLLVDYLVYVGIAMNADKRLTHTRNHGEKGVWQYRTKWRIPKASGGCPRKASQPLSRLIHR